jgi:hypothetical protein
MQKIIKCHMNTKEHWINKTMESLDGAARAVVSPFLEEKIFRTAVNPQPIPDPGKFRQIVKYAAIGLLLVSLNVVTFLHFHKASTFENPVKSIASEYFSYIDTYNF